MIPNEFDGRVFGLLRRQSVIVEPPGEAEYHPERN
jgi:hypothetical protein